MGFKTDAIQNGVYIDKTFQSVTTPMYASTTYFFAGLGEMPQFDYTRSGNPTRWALEQNLAKLEGGKHATLTATGMGAITTVLFLFRPGDHIIAGKDIYGGTYRLFELVFGPLGYEFSFIDMGNPDELRAAVRPNTRAIWIETPSNPLLNVTDIAAVVALARERNLLTIADNTFLSPWFQRPLEFGVAIVVESMTKYINGHSDVIGGAIVTNNDDLGARLKELSNCLGTPLAAFDSFLVLRGIKTLAYRMEGHQKNALAVARFLERHPRIARVYYPGLESHPHHELAKRQMSGFGGMVSFAVRENALDLSAFVGRLRIFRLAESLGGVESLICQPWSMTHLSMPEDARLRAGITPWIFRLSVGLEETDDLVADLATALGD
ncbi:MAG: PLP-dependent transferase [Candidatus Sumerlaeia bacterium]|nr:PLP-dependent transferase [Candidatus Sumerlaeia bacterium]